MPTTSHAVQPSVVVVGAGFGGLGVAIDLLGAGITDVTILEKADDVGGVWRENTYPNAACDVPSPLYSWSFAPNPDWSHRYSPQPEILDYIRRTAEEYDVLRLVRFGTEVTEAVFDEDTARWRVRTSAGETLEADVFVVAVGQLSRPALPDIPGVADFAGTAFHSAAWDHEADLAGKRVAVIGTGASAIQFVPGIVNQVSGLTVFQRSAPYVLPRPDKAYRGYHLRLFERLPATQRFERKVTFTLTEVLNRAVTGGRTWKRLLRLVFRLHLRSQVKDRALRRRLLPDYEVGCKRLLFSTDWYDALTLPHVDVVTDPIERIEAGGVRTADGRLHPADVIVYGTGFAATQFLVPMRVTGSDGRDLHEVWSSGAHAHLGISVPGFPNMFVMYGPNTNLGGSSIIGMLEAQSAYVVQLVRRIADGAARCLDVRPEVAAAYDREMQERLRDSVWAGCHNWYKVDGGRISTNWPGLVAEYQRRTRTVDFAAYAEMAEPRHSGN